MREWQLQEAKQRFSELIRAVENDGPQSVTRHGKEVAVVVDTSTYQRLQWEPSDDFKRFLTEGPSFDDLEFERDETPTPVIDVT